MSGREEGAPAPRDTLIAPAPETDTDPNDMVRRSKTARARIQALVRIAQVEGGLSDLAAELLDLCELINYPEKLATDRAKELLGYYVEARDIASRFDDSSDRLEGCVSLMKLALEACEARDAAPEEAS